MADEHNENDVLTSSFQFSTVESPLLGSPSGDPTHVNDVGGSERLRRFPLYRKESCSGFWRSEDMSCMHIIAQRDVLRQTLFYIGRLGKAHLLDLNEGIMAFARPYTAELRLCQELLHKIRRLEEPLAQEKVLEGDFAVDYDYGCSIEEMRQEINGSGVQWSGEPEESHHSFSLEKIEERVDEMLDRVEAMTTNLRTFHMELNNDHELRLLYRLLTSDQAAERYQETAKHVASSLAGEMGAMNTISLVPRPAISGLRGDGGSDGRREYQVAGRGGVGRSTSPGATFSAAYAYGDALRRLPHITGAVRTPSMEEIRRLSYRVCRGNAVVVQSFSQLFFDPETGERSVSRCMFAIFCSSVKMLTRLKKLVEGLGAAVTLHTLDEVLERGAVLQYIPSPLDEAGREDKEDPIRSVALGGEAGAEEDEEDASGKRKKARKHQSRLRSLFSFSGSAKLPVVSSLPLQSLPSLEEEQRSGSSAYLEEDGTSPVRPRRLPPTDAASSKKSSKALMETIELCKRQRSSLLVEWYSTHRILKTFLRVEQVVLEMMNRCEMVGPTATMVLWIPTKYIPILQSVLDDAVHDAGGDVPSVMTLHTSQRHPPTYFETNSFTGVFQGIVDSYGMARYKEANPGVFTIITFPYLFGMMYGDIGHGVLLLLVSLFFIYKGLHWREETLNEMVQMLFNGRYLLLLMSFFAIYMGFLYNDFMGFSLNLFSSGYKWGHLEFAEGHEHELVYPTHPNGRPSVRPSRSVRFGLDPAWAETENKLEFYNSVKMKCAVIVGVVQMFVGLFISLSNYVYHKDWARIYFLFIPEFVFLLCTFGYMSLLIIIKWCTRWENTHLAPSLLETMTNFFLQPGTVSAPLFRGQAGLQVFLLLVAFLMVPILLCGMPIYEYKRYRLWKSLRHKNLVDGVTITNLPAADEVNRAGGEGGESTPTSHGASPMREGGSLQQDTPAVRTQNDFLAQDAEVGGARSHAVQGPGSGNEENRKPADDPLRFRSDDPTSPSEESSGVQLATQKCNIATFFSLGLKTFTEDEEEGFEDFELSELIIHYVIHTIEYVLSTVSNTASYLRLWALSLAHAQLSEVFFNFTVVKLLALDDTGILIGFGVLVWLGVTFAVLVGMEALSSFLHALRLHWVEFQNKFYMGDGRPLEPFVLPHAH